MPIEAVRDCSRRVVRALLCAVAVAFIWVAPIATAAEVSGTQRTSINVVADDNYPPYLFRDENAHTEGYLVDFWKLWEKKTGVQVNFKPMAWSLAQETIQAGKADVIDTIFETEPRMSIYDFTTPYADLPVNIYTNKSVGGITDVKTLQGFLVGVMAGDACIDILAQDGITYLRKYPSYRSLILAAARGEVKVFCLDEGPADYYFYKLNVGANFRKAFQLYVGQFHRAVRKGDLATLELVQRGMNMISPQEEAEMRRKWFGSPVDLTYYGQRFGLFLLVAAALSGILFLWNVMLRQRVSTRTADLQKTLIELRNAQSLADDYRLTLEQRVTERTLELNRTAESLRLSSDELHAIFDAATVGIALIHKGVIQSCNSTMEVMFGYQQDQLTGVAVRLLYPDDRSYALDSEQIDRDLLRHGEFRKESELQRRDGSRFWCRMMVQPIVKTSLGEGFAVTFEDITLEQEAMAEIEKARKLAEDAAAMKSSFLANMSHEIRTPMNAIIGMTHLALKTDPPAKLADYLRKIDRSSKHLLGIINDILDFSKVEAGKMVIERSSFDLQSLIDNATGLLAEIFAEKGLRLVVDIAPDVPKSLVGDPLRISQILINYLNNAVKFTEAGQVTITVTNARRQDGSREIRFAVRDTGIGLTEDQRKKLFESFQQADTSTTRKFGGTGLGLAISKRLTELMGGEVGVESAPGVGSTFWFTIPLEEGVVTVPSPPTPSSNVSRRILVVDDDDAAREVERSLLEEMGYSVVTVASGREALAELQREPATSAPYDLVLLDWKMPGMDGVTTAIKIRESRLQKLPLILMVTAYDPQELKYSAAQIGKIEVLAKPLSRKALGTILMRLLGSTDSERGVPGQGAAGESPAPLDIRGARALLVEDNELNQEVAYEILKEFGLLVDLVGDGAAAIHKLETQHYDVVLMDVQMPVMDGIQATIKIRQDPRYATLPIIAMTASVMEEDQKKCLDAGMNDHVAKPIEPEHLLRTLKKWIRPTSGNGALHATGHPSVQAQEARIPEVLLTVAGLDAGQGLQRANGKPSLYFSILGKFVANQGRVPDEITRAIDAGDWKEALRLAHTLKGLSGTIGATDVMAAAEILEATISDGKKDTKLDSALMNLRFRLEALIAGLTPAIQAVTAVAVDPDKAEKIEAVCAKLRQLLAVGDAEATEVLGRNADLLAREFPAEFRAIDGSIKNFDYEAALSALERACARQLT